MENIDSELLRQSELLASMLNQNNEGKEGFTQDFYAMYLKAQKMLEIINEPISIKPAENNHFIYMLKDLMPFIDNSLTKKFNAFVKLVELKGILENDYENKYPSRDTGQADLLKAMLPHVPKHRCNVLLSYIKILEIQQIIRGE